MMQVQKGNMAEYLLPAVLVGLVAVGGLAWTLQGSFTQQGAISLFQGNQVLSSSGGKSVIETRQFGQNPYLQTLSLTTEKGTRLVLPNVPVSIMENIEVNGGHGTVEQFSALLESLADQLLASGEIDASNALAIKKLANQGHHMGNLLGEMDALILSCGESKACLENNFFTGRASNGDTFGEIHGSVFPVTANEVTQIPEYQAANRLKIPTQAQRQAMDAINMSVHQKKGDYSFLGENLVQFAEDYSHINLSQLSPKALAILNFSAAQITSIPMFHSTAIRSLGSSNSKHEEWRFPNKNGEAVIISTKDFQITERNHLTRLLIENNLGNMTWPSEVVHANSGVICTTGQGADTGRTCR